MNVNSRSSMCRYKYIRICMYVCMFMNVYVCTCMYTYVNYRFLSNWNTFSPSTWPSTHSMEKTQRESVCGACVRSGCPVFLGIPAFPVPAETPRDLKIATASFFSFFFFFGFLFFLFLSVLERRQWEKSCSLLERRKKGRIWLIDWHRERKRESCCCCKHNVTTYPFVVCL